MKHEVIISNGGIKQRASNGSLGFYRRKCYGYDKDENGNLVINKEQAEIVRLIFDLICILVVKAY